MALDGHGQLEDLPIVDIVQVIALSRRSGRLLVENGAGQQVILGFQNGRIVSARTWETPPLASQTLPATPEEREELVRCRVRGALRLLLSLEAGRFEFQAEDEPAPGLSRSSFEELQEGLDAQGALLELLKQRDERNVRATPEAPAPSLERVDLGDARMMAEFKRRLEALLIADPASRYAVGIAYKGMGMLDDAIREFERAACNPRFAFEGASMLGLCHLEKRDARLAIRWLERGLALLGRSPHEYQGLRVLLALAYAAAGRMSDALALYEQFGRRGVWLADSEAKRDLQATLPGAQVLPFTRTAS